MANPYEHHPHYVPIIKWQLWEQRALSNVPPADALRTLPCIEVRMPKQHKSMLENFAAVWKYPALVDYADPEGQLTAARIKELQQFLKKKTGSFDLASPVLNPATAAVYFPLISGLLNDRKVTLRLRLASIAGAAPALPIVQAALLVPGLKACTDRLIVDLCTTPNHSHADALALAGVLSALKGLGFAHVHLASGSFPESLMHINGAGEVERKDWKLFEAVSAVIPGTKLGFADYGPLNPNWTEKNLERRGGRAIIRYALDDKWRIIRGLNFTIAESIAISTLMVGGYAHEFKGPAFSFGDKLISDRADPAVPLKDKKAGHYQISEFWTHHIAHVVKLQY